MAIISAVESFTSKLSQRTRKSARKSSGDDFLPPLKPFVLLRVHPEHQLALSEQGWTTVGFGKKSKDALYNIYRELLRANQAFSDLPNEYKQTFETQHRSEEGWSRVEGKKEFVTLRTLKNTPNDLKDASSKFWAEAGGLLNETMGKVAESLDLRVQALTVFSEPCGKLGNVEMATILCLLAHADLGLLSFVISDKSGLEVMDSDTDSWFPLEQSYKSPKGSLLVGRHFESLSNARYRAGRHRVRSYPNPESNTRNTSSLAEDWRHAMVFLTRAQVLVLINTDELTTEITGPFLKSIRGVTSRELLDEIHEAHFKINTGLEEKDVQRKGLAEQERYAATSERFGLGILKLSK